MKIVQVCLTIDQLQGGAPCSTLGSFIELNKNGIDSNIFAFGESKISISNPMFLPKIKPELRKKILTIYRDKQNLYGHFLSFKEFKNFYTLCSNADLIIVHQIYGLHSIYSIFCCKKLRKPFIIMPHGSLTKYDQSQKAWKKKIANLMFYSWFLRNANSIFVASEIEALEVQKSFKINDLAIVGLGFPMHNEKILIDSKKSDGEINLLFMGRITKKKRLDLTIRALHSLAEEYPNIRLIVAGDGDRKLVKQYTRLVEELDITEMVVFKGWLSASEKWREIDNSDFFILNSEDENFAVIVPEVQSRGIPAILTKNVAFAEIVRKYNSGVVLDSNDVPQIVEGFKKISLMDYAVMSKNAIRCAKSSEWEEIIQIWISNLDRVMGLVNTKPSEI